MAFGVTLSTRDYGSQYWQVEKPAAATTIPSSRVENDRDARLGKSEAKTRNKAEHVTTIKNTSTNKSQQ